MNTPTAPADDITLPALSESPTHGMNLGERIAHVGGRTNAHGYIEFGSVMAVDALIKQVLRDVPATQVEGFQARYRLPDGEWSSWGHVVCGVKCHEQELRIAPDRASPSRAAWIDVAARLPEPGKAVLLDIGKKTPIRAMWVLAKSLEASDEEGFGEYDEAADMYYCPEGWYEWNEHEETHWAVSATPLRWMALPLPGDAATDLSMHPLEQGARTIAAQAGADADEFLAWLQGGGMAEMALSHFAAPAQVPAPVVQVDDDYADLRMALANDPQRWHCDANMTPFYNDADGYSRGGDYAGTYCVFGDPIVIEDEHGDEEEHDGLVLIEICGKNDAMYIEACAPDTIRALLAEVDSLRATPVPAAVDVGAAQAETAQAAPVVPADFWDRPGPQVAAPMSGREPTLREVISGYYRFHGVEAKKANKMAADYIAATPGATHGN